MIAARHLAAAALVGAGIALAPVDPPVPPPPAAPAPAAAAPASTAPATSPRPPETPAQRDSRLSWWREARYGLFIHWGVYAVAAGSWEGKAVPGVGEWIMHHGKIPVEAYETLAPRFNPVKFDAAAWVSLAKRAGMKYIVITSKHHDGFCMFDSALTRWDIVDATPFKRDPLAELAAACRAEGIRLCFYHSILDWHHPDARGERFVTHYLPVLRAQLKELLEKYGDIGVLWFDGEWADKWTDALGRDLERHVRTLQPSIIVNNRVGKGRDGMAGLSKSPDSPGDFGTPEQEVPANGLPGVDWETCMTMNDTWGFKSDDHNWKSTESLLRRLVDIASKGGNFLLNVGPTAEGEIPAASVERLEAVGAWLRTNGQAIHGTRASPIGAPSWGRCTAAPGRLYLHVFDWPADGSLVVPFTAQRVTKARLLAAPGTTLEVEAAQDGVRVRVPPEAPDPIVSVIVLEFEEAAPPGDAQAPARPAGAARP